MTSRFPDIESWTVCAGTAAIRQVCTAMMKMQLMGNLVCISFLSPGKK